MSIVLSMARFCKGRRRCLTVAAEPFPRLKVEVKVFKAKEEPVDLKSEFAEEEPVKAKECPIYFKSKFAAKVEPVNVKEQPIDFKSEPFGVEPVKVKEQPIDFKSEPFGVEPVKAKEEHIDCKSESFGVEPVSFNERFALKADMFEVKREIEEVQSQLDNLLEDTNVDDGLDAANIKYRFERRGKRDFAIGEGWVKRARVTWEEQTTPCSLVLPKCMGGKPTQPFYPPPADVFIAGCFFKLKRQNDFVPRVAVMAESWLCSDCN